MACVNWYLYIAALKTRADNERGVAWISQRVLEGKHLLTSAAICHTGQLELLGCWLPQISWGRGEARIETCEERWLGTWEATLPSTYACPGLMDYALIKFWTQLSYLF